jgi:hypothetical protein
MATKTRNRVIYQSEALYVGQPSSTGCHFNATIEEDGTAPTPVDTSGKLFGLVKNPDALTELCILDWEDYWTTISKPVDRDIEEWADDKAYVVDDIVKVTETVGTGAGEEYFFECKLDLDLDDPAIPNVYNLTAAGETRLAAITLATPPAAGSSINKTDFDALPATESFVEISDPTNIISLSDYNALTGAAAQTPSQVQADYEAAPSQSDYSFVTERKYPPITSLKDFTGGGLYDFSSKDLADWTIAMAVRQLNRVQSANYSFSFNRQDVNQFGQLHRIDSVAIDPPTVSLDFSYYLNNGANEKLMGFFLNDYDDMVAKAAKNFINIKEQEDDFEGRNYFILTTAQGEDAVENNAWDSDGFPQDDSYHSSISLGNGYVTNYGVEASVGAMPTASVTIEGLNLKSDAGFHNIAIPAVDNGRGTPIEGVKYSLPAPVSGVLDDGVAPDPTKDGDLFTGVADGFSCLRPGDIEMHLGTDGEAGLMNKLPAGTPPTDHQPLGCHVQSFSIDMPMGRTPLQRLGTPYAYTRPLDMPLTVTINVSAIVADLKSSNVADHLFNFENHDLHFILREPQVDGAGPISMAFYAKGAQLEGESFSSSIGDNKTVDITFTCQVGGAEDTSRGIMVSGSRGAIPDKSKGETYTDYPLISRFDPATK